MLDVRFHIAADGRSPFAIWFAKLDVQARAKITVALARLGQGNLSNAKSVGHGVQEYRIDVGPGYRVYFGRHGSKVVILLTGGTKRRQQQDIARAKELWDDYRRGAGRDEDDGQDR